MGSDRFSTFLPFIFEHECVFAKGHYGDYNYVIAEDVAGDAGGVTKWGIDNGGHPDLSASGIRALTKEQATAIYREEWEREGCEEHPFPLGEAFFDACVNAGRSRAQKILVASKDDAVAFIEERENFYRRLVDAKPALKKFLRGWLARTQDLKKFLGL